MQITKETADELAIHVERGKKDFPYFCSAILGIHLHAGQLKAWDATSKRYVTVNIYLCGNRSGKTVYVSCKHIWKAFYKITGPGRTIAQSTWSVTPYTTVNFAPHSEQTTIIFDHIMQIVRGEFPVRDKDGTTRTNRSLIRYFLDDDRLSNPNKPPKTGPYELSYYNGANFRAYTLGGSHGDAVQGRSFGYASYDEFGRSKEPEKEFVDITTRLGDWKAELDIITTPDENNADASDWLNDKVEKAEDTKTGFRFINWPTTDNPYMPQDSIDVMLVGKTPEQVRQILSGMIVKASQRWFGLSKVNLMFDEKRSPGHIIDFVNHFPSSDRLYFGGLDTSGLGKDAWSFYIVDYTVKPFRIVYSYASSTATPGENKRISRNIIEQFQDYAGKANFRWHIDYTSEGGTIIFDDMRDLNPIPFSFGIQKGSGKNMKFELLDTARRCIQEECLLSPTDDDLLRQMVMYRGPKEDKGQVTDRVMALSMAIYRPFLDSVREKESWIVDF